MNSNLNDSYYKLYPMNHKCTSNESKELCYTDEIDKFMEVFPNVSFRKVLVGCSSKEKYYDHIVMIENANTVESNIGSGSLVAPSYSVIGTETLIIPSYLYMNGIYYRVMLPGDCSDCFHNCDLRVIDLSHVISLDNVVLMSCMFSNCENLESVIIMDSDYEDMELRDDISDIFSNSPKMNSTIKDTIISKLSSRMVEPDERWI